VSRAFGVYDGRGVSSSVMEGQAVWAGTRIRRGSSGGVDRRNDRTALGCIEEGVDTRRKGNCLAGRIAREWNRSTPLDLSLGHSRRRYRLVAVRVPSG